MAWNEPGNKDKRRDPWQDGEPRDLDAALKQLKDRFGRFFGAGGGFPGPLLIVSCVGRLVCDGLVAGHRRARARRRLAFRGVSTASWAPGLNFKWPRPIETVDVVETTRVRSDSAEVRMLTKDEALVMVDFNVQYTASDPESCSCSAAARPRTPCARPPKARCAR